MPAKINSSHPTVRLLMLPLPVDTVLVRDHDPLFVYKALVEKIVDGDTLEVKIDLGFKTWSTQDLRLRGINTAELPKPAAMASKPATPPGTGSSLDSGQLLAKRAKAFVASKLAGVKFVVIKTYKTDIYGRFVADVFYHPQIENKHDVARKGFFLNEELLKAGLALPSLV